MTQDSLNLSESLEDYLEIILKLEKANYVARAKETAEQMGVGYFVNNMNLSAGGSWGKNSQVDRQ